MSLNLLSRVIPSVQKCLFNSKTGLNLSASLQRQLSLYQPLHNAEPVDSSQNEVSVKDASKDRTKVIPVETSIRYLQSSAYATTYGDEPVWKQYRRNHKGSIPPKKTRKTCIRNGTITTGNPCPICRDEYLVPDPHNVELLRQFISPYTGEVLSYKVTGVCQKRYKELLVAIEVAKDEGLLTYDVPFRSYNYSLYKPQS